MVAERQDVGAVGADEDMTVSAGRVPTPWCDFAAVWTARGLAQLSYPGDGPAVSAAWIRRHAQRARIVDARSELSDLAQELTGYLEGRTRSFSVPLDLRGTPFQLSVWSALLDIPYGETRSYGDVARAIGRPSAVRAVGAANGANPVPIVVPCHRVIGSTGTLTGYGGGVELKERLLRLEGVLLQG